MEQLEEDMHHQRRANIDLVTERNQESAKFEATLEEMQAELESALAKQKAELEEQYEAKFDTGLEEGIQEVTTNYKAQL